MKQHLSTVARVRRVPNIKATLQTLNSCCFSITTYKSWPCMVISKEVDTVHIVTMFLCLKLQELTKHCSQQDWYLAYCYHVLCLKFWRLSSQIVKKFFVRFLTNWDVETQYFPTERRFTIDLDSFVAKQGTKFIVTKGAVDNKPYEHHKCCPKCKRTIDLAQKFSLNIS